MCTGRQEQARMFLCRALVVIISLSTSSVRADWVKGYFSEKSGIDSIERFLVISDYKDSTFLGRGIAPAGDVNGDGLQDVLLCRSWYGKPYTDRNCYLFYGGEPVDSGFQREFHDMGEWTEAIGDVNGDGFVDFGCYPGPQTVFHLYFGGPSMDDVPDLVIPCWSYVSAAADFDADGNKEIALSKDMTCGPVNIYDIEAGRDTIPEYVIADTTTSFGNNIAVGDVNGDGWPDLVVSAYLNRRTDTCKVKFYWGGPGFDTIPDFEIHSTSPFFGKLLIPLDFNGDGYDDIFISGGANHRYGVYFGGPLLDDEIDVMVNWGFPYFPPDAAACVGDANHDGYSDLLLSYDFDAGIYLYLGGPDADSIVDVYINTLDVPGGQYEFGLEMAGVGDFNGDGIDDFAVYSRTEQVSHWISEVNFFAGWDSSPTAVSEDEESTLPSGFVLSQNYPNPFNATTTIPFELSCRSEVTLTIVNMLGETVRTLGGREYAAGHYALTWDGRDRRGAEASSGVYFYTLHAGKTSQTKKMVLLK